MENLNYRLAIPRIIIDGNGNKTEVRLLGTEKDYDNSIEELAKIVSGFKFEFFYDKGDLEKVFL